MLCDHGDDLKVDTSIAVSQFASTFSQSTNSKFSYWHVEPQGYLFSRTVLASHDQQCLCDIIDCKGTSEFNLVIVKYNLYSLTLYLTTSVNC